jgi:hypothetical protein
MNIEQITESMKEHPYIVIGGVVLFLFLITRSGSSQGAVANNGAAYTIQSQALAGQTSVQLAQINAAQTAQSNAVAGQMWAAKYSTDAAVATSNNKLLVQGIVAKLNNDTNQQQIQSVLTQNLASVQASHDEAVSAINARTQQVQLNSNAALSALGQQLAFQLTPAVMTHEEKMAQTQGAAQVAYANAIGNAAVAQINARSGVVPPSQVLGYGAADAAASVFGAIGTGVAQGLSGKIAGWFNTPAGDTTSTVTAVGTPIYSYADTANDASTISAVDQMWV